MGCAASAPGHVASAAERKESKERRSSLSAELAIGEFHQDFLLGAKLGAGAFGSVFSARRTGSCDEVAVKVVDSQAEDPSGKRLQIADRKRQRAIESEVDILQSLPQSECIIDFHGFYLEEGLVYMVIEKCSMGLQPFLERVPVLTEATLRPVFQDMMTGIAAIHAASIVHRDVKCDNFLVARRGSGGFVVKLCDFGLAGRLSSGDADELCGSCGTPPYMAPEILHGMMYGAKVDVWAMGVLAYVLLCGVWPYMPKHLSGPDMKAAIKLGSPGPTFTSGPRLADISGRASSWVRALLRRDPASRPSAQESLQHSSFKAWDSSARFGSTLRAAARCGAFEPPGRASESRKDLDETLLRMNARWHPVSEISTAASSVSPSRRK